MVLTGKKFTDVELKQKCDALVAANSVGLGTVTPQAAAILKNFPDFPWDKFSSWFKRNHSGVVQVNGGHMHRYFSDQIDKDLE